MKTLGTTLRPVLVPLLVAALPLALLAVELDGTRVTSCDPSCKRSKAGTASCTAEAGGSCVTGYPVNDSEYGLNCCISQGPSIDILATGCFMKWESNTIIDRVLVPTTSPGYQAREEKLPCSIGLVCAYYVDVANNNCAGQPSPTFTCAPTIPLTLTFECHITPC